LFGCLFYLAVMLFAIPIYVIVLSILCIVWLFMIIKFLITG
jgi:hypothetical protein